MSNERRELEPEASPREAEHLESEPTQAESGKKGGAVMAARSPGFGVITRDLTLTEAHPEVRAGGLTNWVAALFAGVAAGALLLGVELLLTPILLGTTMWAPVRLMASVVVGEEALVPPLTFDAGMAVTGLLVHFAVCAALALLIAPLLRWFERGPAAVMGAAYGLLTYNLVFYAAALISPTLVFGRGVASIVGHVLFGMSVAALYRTFAGPPEAPIPDPPPAHTLST